MSLNNIRVRPLSWTKSLLIGKKTSRKLYTIRAGVYRNLRLQLDLQSETQMYLGLAERETHVFIRKALKTCKWMVDVGAGKGELCILFLKASQSEQIYAIEPQKSETEVMRKSLLDNGDYDEQQLVVLNSFIGTDPTKCISLDSLPLDRNQRGFIKIDVDGYELDVLNSGVRLFLSSNLDVLIETHSKQLEYKCIEWLIEKGYTVTIVKNAWWRIFIPEKRPIEHNRWLWATKG